METPQKEIYRYLGMKEEAADEKTRLLVADCLRELQEAAKPRSFYRVYPLEILPDGVLDLTCMRVRSRDLGKNLAGCEAAVLFAATLGAGVDRLLLRYGRLAVSRAAVLQAASAAMIEAYCDGCNERLREEARAKGFFLRPRFSPGYGDFALSCQRDLCRALEAEKTVGITLTEGGMMAPSKSVTAVIGAGRAPASRKEEGCGTCEKRDSCAFVRREKAFFGRGAADSGKSAADSGKSMADSGKSGTDSGKSGGNDGSKGCVKGADPSV